MRRTRTHSRPQRDLLEENLDFISLAIQELASTFLAACKWLLHPGVSVNVGRGEGGTLLCEPEAVDG